MRWKTTERRIDELEDEIGGIGHVIQENSIPFIHRSNLNFIGSGATVTDNPTNDSTDVYVNEIPLSNNYGLFAQTELSLPITNTTVESSLIGNGVGTLYVPANFFKVGDSFIAKMCGSISCNNAETIHIRVKSDGNVIADAGIFALNIATNKYFELVIDFTITKIGEKQEAELFVNGQFSYNKNANSQLDGNNFALIDSTNFDTTIQNDLSITAQWGSASVKNIIQSQNFVLNKIY